MGAFSQLRVHLPNHFSLSQVDDNNNDSVQLTPVNLSIAATILLNSNFYFLVCHPPKILYQYQYLNMKYFPTFISITVFNLFNYSIQVLWNFSLFKTSKASFKVQSFYNISKVSLKSPTFLNYGILEKFFFLRKKKLNSIYSKGKSRDSIIIRSKQKWNPAVSKAQC